MPKIKPFRAIIYNQQKTKDLNKFLCPPYDVISPLRQQYYHELSPHNFIHILLGKDIPGDDKYERAENYFNDWLKNRIFVQDEFPALYFYSQQYNLKGENKVRSGFIALLRLEEKNSGVFGHEHTHVEPKEDRLRLLIQVKASLSPIFVVFADHKRIIQQAREKYVQDQKPFIDIVDEEKTVHKLWRMDSSKLIERISYQMQNENIFIADGHHRYEVACTYREQMKNKLGIITGEEDFNYILAYFTNIESRGLTILPIHRLVKLNSMFDPEKPLTFIADYFDIEEVKDKHSLFFLMEKGGRAEHIIGMYKDKRYFLLRLKNVKLLDKIISDRPPDIRTLDVSILNYLIFKKILGINFEDKQNIIFSQDANELFEKVDSDASSIALFLNPVKIQQIIPVALSGEKMPAKSTYFYPKVLSGLVINKHEDIRVSHQDTTSPRHQ